MDILDFIQLYIMASDEVKNQINEILIDSQQPLEPEE